MTKSPQNPKVKKFHRTKFPKEKIPYDKIPQKNKNSPLGTKKVKNNPKIKSKPKVRIERNIKDISCSAT